MMIKKSKKHTHARFTNISILLLQWMIVITLLLLNVTPALGLTLEDEQNQKLPSLGQPTEPKTNEPSVPPPPEPINDGTITPPDEIPPEEPKNPIENQPDETPEETIQPIETETNTELQATILPETTLQNNVEKINPVESTTSTQNIVTPAQTSFTIETINTTSETGINQLEVYTYQTYNEVSAEISTTDQKPTTIPTIKLQNENDYIESYISINLLGDNLALTNRNIQSITMIIKIQKQTNQYSTDIHHQILALSYSSTMPFDQSFPLKEQFITQYNNAFWQPIQPVEITEDEQYYYYHVETSSYFATFAIVGTEVVEVQPYQSGIPEIPWGAIAGTSIAATALLFIVLFKTGFIYQIEENTDGTRKKKILRQTNQKWSYKVRLTSTLPDLQAIRAPTLYFPMTTNVPQVLNASTEVQNNSEELDEDLMYL